MVFGTYRDPKGLPRTALLVGGVLVLLVLAVLAVGFMPGFATFLLFFCAVSTAGTLVLWKLFD